MNDIKDTKGATLKPGDRWYDPTASGLGYYSVTKISFVNAYTPTGKEDAVWNADVEDKGLIKVYRTGRELVIAGDGKIYANEDSSAMFRWLISLAVIEGLDLLDTSKVTDMRGMFEDCRNLESLDLSGFNTSNVTNMSSMFNNCSALTNLDVSGFDTSKVTNMSAMFWGCDNLKLLDLRGFDMRCVTESWKMYSDANTLVLPPMLKS